MKKVLAGVLCGLALISSAQANDKASKEKVISTVSGTMAAMAMSQGAKNCFYEAWMMVSGYEFAQNPGALDSFLSGQGLQLESNYKDLLRKGATLSRPADPAVKRYFEECLAEAEDSVLSAAK